MAGRLSTTILQEKRRLYFVAIASFYSGILFYHDVGTQVLGAPFPLFAGGLYAVFATVGALAVSMLMPGMATLIEPLAVSRVCVSLYVLFNPIVGKAVLANPSVMALLVVAGAIFIRRGMARPEMAVERSAI